MRGRATASPRYQHIGEKLIKLGYRSMLWTASPRVQVPTDGDAFDNLGEFKLGNWSWHTKKRAIKEKENPRRSFNTSRKEEKVPF